VLNHITKWQFENAVTKNYQMAILPNGNIIIGYE